MEEILDIYFGNKKCILLGDINIDYKTDSFYSRKLKQLFNVYGVDQVVSEYTTASL